MLVCAFFCASCTRDRGCSAHPAFPAPSVWRVKVSFKDPGAWRCGNTKLFPVILRCERSEPRRMNRPQSGPSSFEARKSAHLRMTVRDERVIQYSRDACDQSIGRAEPNQSPPQPLHKTASPYDPSSARQNAIKQPRRRKTAGRGESLVRSLLRLDRPFRPPHAGQDRGHRPRQPAPVVLRAIRCAHLAPRHPSARQAQGRARRPGSRCWR